MLKTIKLSALLQRLFADSADSTSRAAPAAMRSFRACTSGGRRHHELLARLCPDARIAPSSSLGLGGREATPPISPRHSGALSGRGARPCRS